MSAIAPRESQSIAAVDRALDVLLLFGETGRRDLGVTEISTRLGLSKAAVHRILTSLRLRDVVVLDASTRRYCLGPAALSLGRAYMARLDLRSLAAPELEGLATRTQETASLSIRVGDTRIYIDQVLPDREVRMEVAVGQPYPLHAGAASKAFLAFLPDAEISAHLMPDLLWPVTDKTITDADHLRRDLAVTRDRGYATSAGERSVGAASVAAPVLDPEGLPVAVVSVSGPAERLLARVESCSELVLASSRRLSGRMGHVA